MLIMLLILLIPTGAALAGGSTLYWNHNLTPTIQVTAWKRAETNGANSQYRGRIKSYTIGPAIDRIGWWWWSVQQWCNGSPYSTHNYGGHVLYNAAWTASTSPYYNVRTCSGQQVRTNGAHDFVEGGSTWSPNFTATYNIP